MCSSDLLRFHVEDGQLEVRQAGLLEWVENFKRLDARLAFIDDRVEEAPQD